MDAPETVRYTIKVKFKLEGHKNTVFLHFLLILFILFCKLHWFFTSCESG